MERVKFFIADLENMILESSHNCIDWKQTKGEQGPWSTKNPVSMWIKSETNLVLMIELLTHRQRRVTNRP